MLGGSSFEGVHDIDDGDTDRLSALIQGLTDRPEYPPGLPCRFSLPS